jgi:hypothetical protein
MSCTKFFRIYNTCSREDYPDLRRRRYSEENCNGQQVFLHIIL